MTITPDSMTNLLHSLFPICRSITGPGVRETLEKVREVVPLDIKSYESGKTVFDWQIPKEWSVKDAWIKNSDGTKLIDFKINNVHLMSYSTPIHKMMTWNELSSHIFYLETLPAAIPYRTSYYNENWGFCVSYDQLTRLLGHDKYEVFIDSDLKNGTLDFGELLIPGKTSDEILISTYLCHPSLANDNLSGVVTTAFLAKLLLERNNQLSYRIIWVPETIGAIAYSYHNLDKVKNALAGLIVTCCGGPGLYGYKQSFDLSHPLNKIVESVFSHNQISNAITYPFDIHGSDERQYSSPGIGLNCVTISRDKYYEYDYYHTSLDNLDFVSGESLYESLGLYLDLTNMLDQRRKELVEYRAHKRKQRKTNSKNSDSVFERIEPHGELMLSKHDLYPKVGGALLPNSNCEEELNLILKTLFHLDGINSVKEIAEKLNVPKRIIQQLLKLFLEKNIIKPA